MKQKSVWNKLLNIYVKFGITDINRFSQWCCEIWNVPFPPVKSVCSNSQQSLTWLLKVQKLFSTQVDEWKVTASIGFEVAPPHPPLIAHGPISSLDKEKILVNLLLKNGKSLLYFVAVGEHEIHNSCFVRVHHLHHGGKMVKRTAKCHLLKGLSHEIEMG